MPPKRESSRSAKPVSVSSRPPASRRGAAAAKAATPVPAASTTEAKPQSKANGKAAEPVVNGNGKKSLDESDADEAKPPPAKKGRVAQLASGGEARSHRRRSSTASGQINQIPQPPAPSQPHNALFVFGTGDMGQFGLGPDELQEIGRPKLHSWFEEQIEDGKLTGLEAVACGGMHTLAVDKAGQVWSWGINDNAALGRITTDVPKPDAPGETIPNEDLESYPFVVESLKKDNFRAVQVQAGDSVSVAVSDAGEIRVWGSFRSNDGVLGFDGVPGHSPFQFTPSPLPGLARERVVQVSCGSDHVLALTTEGRVWVWGNAQQAQLGRKVSERHKINGLAPTKLALRNITYINAGMYHSFAVDQSGIVYAWGLNTFHQTGVSSDRGGKEDMVITPTPVDALHPDAHDGSRVVQIAGGEHHTIFLFDNGEVWGCGRCDANQLGLSKDHPAQEGLDERRAEAKKEKEKKVDEAKKHLEKITQDGDADQEDKEEAERAVVGAEAALSAALDEFVPEPVRIAFPPIPEQYEVVPVLPPYAQADPGMNPVAEISAGTRHNLAVSRSGHVYSWGLGMGAQLGLASQETAETPSLVRSKLLRPYTALHASAGGQHCVLLAKKKQD